MGLPGQSSLIREPWVLSVSVKSDRPRVPKRWRIIGALRIPGRSLVELLERGGCCRREPPLLSAFVAPDRSGAHCQCWCPVFTDHDCIVKGPACFLHGSSLGVPSAAGVVTGAAAWVAGRRGLRSPWRRGPRRRNCGAAGVLERPEPVRAWRRHEHWRGVAGGTGVEGGGLTQGGSHAWEARERSGREWQLGKFWMGSGRGSGILVFSRRARFSEKLPFLGNSSLDGALGYFVIDS